MLWEYVWTAEGVREETYRDKTEQKRQRECLIRTDNPCRRLSASRYVDNFFFFFFSLKSPDVSKAKVTGLLVCVVFM